MVHRRNFVRLTGGSAELNLGPLLFLIFINYFPNCSDFLKFTLFTDDMYINKASIHETSDILTTELQNINNWVNSNRIKSNSEKNKFIIFSYRKNIEIEQISFGNNYIHKKK